MVGTNNVGGIKIIFIILEGLFNDFWVWDNKLEPRRLNLYRTLSSLKVFFSILGRTWYTFFGIFKLI